MALKAPTHRWRSVARQYAASIGAGLVILGAVSLAALLLSDIRLAFQALSVSSAVVALILFVGVLRAG
jgi:hypothetical protein